MNNCKENEPSGCYSTHAPKFSSARVNSSAHVNVVVDVDEEVLPSSLSSVLVDSESDVEDVEVSSSSVSDDALVDDVDEYVSSTPESDVLVVVVEDSSLQTVSS